MGLERNWGQVMCSQAGSPEEEAGSDHRGPWSTETTETGDQMVSGHGHGKEFGFQSKEAGKSVEHFGQGLDII